MVCAAMDAVTPTDYKGTRLAGGPHQPALDTLVPVSREADSVNHLAGLRDDWFVVRLVVT